MLTQLSVPGLGLHGEPRDRLGSSRHRCLASTSEVTPADKERASERARLGGLWVGGRKERKGRLCSLIAQLGEDGLPQERGGFRRQPSCVSF